ncbi:hypothetical protein K3495_g14447 [Podosphaera aphanis]|nr:hypothetical protein K3495_g14447 [Podosphaera aphanis]
MLTEFLWDDLVPPHPVKSALNSEMSWLKNMASSIVVTLFEGDYSNSIKMMQKREV